TRYLVTAVVVLGGLVAAPAALGYVPQLTRYPYLTDVVENTATVNWATDRSDATGRLRYGRAGVEPCTAHSATATRTSVTINGIPEYMWRATVNGLAPGARYCYRVELGTTAPVVDLLGTDPSISF